MEKKTSKPPKSPQKREKITYVENDLDDGIGDSDGCDSDGRQLFNPKLDVYVRVGSAIYIDTNVSIFPLFCTILGFHTAFCK